MEKNNIKASPGTGGGRGSPSKGENKKNCRKRSRASKRTPTTVLNTDTANFKAMVQHFTGVPNDQTMKFASNPFSTGMGGYFLAPKSVPAERTLSESLFRSFSIPESSPSDFHAQSSSFMAPNFFNSSRGSRDLTSQGTPDLNWEEMFGLAFPATHI